ncbi:MAG TPA: cupin domain-containing protein [Chitinophagaceae bacterium]|nr:cupin domain-containing protein [Chitinophagaceae bacterium]
MKSINLNQKFSLINDLWSPKIIGELNGQEVKISKVKGEFVWHNHKDEDEMFLIIKGKLKIKFKEETVELSEGEMLIIPKGVEHLPVAEDEVWLMLIEPANTKHTGEVKSHLTVEKYERI